ncbi:protein phosphatase 1 regulatory subunit 3C isoform X1 [Drosophila guanche]|uniref:Protein phosphatase 1 regulatory subunit n=1 Tax=Drosophila guanche TaxID=7266 RepID=A0A3B0J3U7_DROGU|nr:protein phosphatase 1 regulatory subunit 3C isoform X1 [Drosophila guanche]SPP76077.1 blast:Protein phosphatase 1 regulatory subunit 3B [Drosophila guanche]
MISHSPPIFSHSPPVSFLADFMSGHQRQALNYNDEPNRASRYCRPQVISLASKAMVNNASAAIQCQPGHQKAGATPLGVGSRSGRSYLERMASAPHLFNQPKSCLSRKSCQHKTPQSPSPIDEPTPENSYVADNCCCTQNNEANGVAHCEQSRGPKKHVIFADDEGLSLTEVRVMSEPSNVPPYWSMKFLEQITQGLVSPHPPDQWTVDFKQPASDYLSFRQKIERDYVSLENVIVKDEESIVVGTIKVKNVDFRKEIIVRVTWDDWKSQQDIFCTFARAYGPTTCAHVIFDTFSFKITLPPSSKRLEFCICYRTNDTEYWDNNDGTNYTISKRSPFYYNALSPYDKGQSRNSSQQIRSTLTDALAKVQDQNGWHQDAHTPYW